MNTRKQQRERFLQQQIHRLDRHLARLGERSDRYSRLRLLAFLLALLVSGGLLLGTGNIWLWAGVSPLLLVPFIILVAVHRRVEGGRRRFTIWRQVKRTHLARMNLDWERIPATLPVPPRLDHPFARDLDLVGDRSIHQLLDTAVSQEGSERIQQWLLETTPNLERTRRRQALVQELKQQSLFRDRLILHAQLIDDEETAGKWPGRRLLTWLETRGEAEALRPWLILLTLLSAATLTLLVLSLSLQLPPVWLITWIPFIIITTFQARKVGPLFQDANFLNDGLQRLGNVFGFLEHYRYRPGSRLRELCAPFLDEETRPSALLKRVKRIITAAGLQYNPLVWFLFNALIPWDITFAYRLRQCQAELKALLPAWLDVWYEVETLSAFANYASLNPDTIFPEVTAVTHSPLLHAVQLGHPLIPDEERVCNDITIDALGTLFLITGSNMAGKSSFLRTLGVNLCLAYAGGTAVAHSLHTTLFRLYSSIRVTDSVTDGYSFFYAEVRRLQAMRHALQADADIPLFFLIDEIFRGTNNRERLIGSRAYVRAMVGGHGVGVIATHDLELVRLADELPPIHNFHFRDDVQDGRMVFDYKLRPGPCPTTNALKIMQLAGLPVPLDNGRA